MGLVIASYLSLLLGMIPLLVIVLIELIQIRISNNKKIKWILPVLSFLISTPICIKTIIEYHNDIFADVIIGSLLIYLPTILFTCTNFIMKNRELTEISKNKLKKYIFIMTIIIIVLVILYFPAIMNLF